MRPVAGQTGALLESRQPATFTTQTMNLELIEKLDALLPQTQCRQCGYRGCRPYAEAMANGAAGANQCPPGGDAVARALATALGVAFQPVDPCFGVHKTPALAVIDEAACIGCRLCIEACPVDAIVGAAKLMHTVIAESCTGCELCLAPCPVDCIRMTPADHAPPAQRARERFDAHERRTTRQRETAAREIAAKTAAARKHRTVEQAIERARTRLAQKRNVR
jgi:electron transport complex protein RnfB